ncbi:MAG: hypothetical protein AAGA48_27960 [Myxococcota bacterium]
MSSHRIAGVPSRRSFLRGLAAFSGTLAGSSALLNATALGQQAADPRFLIVLTASGGGSIIDGPLAIRASESTAPDELNTFPDSLVVGWEDSPFRAVDFSGPAIGQIPAAFRVAPSEVVARHREAMMVATWTRSSVNHQVGQRRAVTGNEAWRGRTMQEMVAWQYGSEAPIPNVHLTAGFGYNEPGTDGTIPPWARGQIVANPAVWPLSLDGSRGQPGVSPEVLAAVRRHRNDVFEPATRFDQVFGASPRAVTWKDLRGTPQQRIEGLDLITKLMVNASGGSLEPFGLERSPAADLVLSAFPNVAADPIEAKAALAFLLLKYRVSVSVTLGPDFGFVYGEGEGDAGTDLPLNSVLNPPLAFDVSHQGHRSGQAVMWSRLYRILDGLIGLLRAEDYGDGTSLWDRTMIYVASDFGRTKNRPTGAEDWGSGHDLNNGILVASPLVPGNTLRGGVDPNTALTYGFDPQTGAPSPGRQMSEAEIFSGLLGALAIDTSGSGLPDVPAMRRS